MARKPDPAGRHLRPEIRLLRVVNYVLSKGFRSGTLLAGFAYCRRPNASISACYDYRSFGFSSL